MNSVCMKALIAGVAHCNRALCSMSDKYKNVSDQIHITHVISTS